PLRFFCQLVGESTTVGGRAFQEKKVDKARILGIALWTRLCREAIVEKSASYFCPTSWTRLKNVYVVGRHKFRLATLRSQIGPKPIWKRPAPASSPRT